MIKLNGYFVNKINKYLHSCIHLKYTSYEVVIFSVENATKFEICCN